ncbi:hypothetical protein EYF80_015925 [Liparis tanakae]|uniref:Uncharacterized protein n=1 Tax=Liparis tanakae TaxID=230148 RepID=A0A4Z2I7I3_9TELE|nr:hypothetical protein EYF80_015925 [Liparis tanakae]
MVGRNSSMLLTAFCMTMSNTHRRGRHSSSISSVDDAVRQRDQLIEQLDEENMVLFTEHPSVQLQKPEDRGQSGCNTYEKSFPDQKATPGHSSRRRTALDRLALISASSSVASRSSRSEYGSRPLYTTSF